MAFCRNCGIELSDGVKFCKRCGTRQAATPVATKGVVSLEEEIDDGPEFFEDDVFDVEDGDVGCEKGLDPNRSYVMRFGGRTAELYNDLGQLIRRFNMRTNVIQATTNGETVTVVTDDGRSYLFHWDGQLIRQFH